MTAAVMLVLCSGLTHAVWNLFTKTCLNKSAFLWLIHGVSLFIFWPFLMNDLLHNDIPPQGYLFMLFSFVLQAAYGLLLAKVYSYGDLSQVYPLMRGTGALLVPVVSVAAFGESLSSIGWIALIVIVGGMFMISGLGMKRPEGMDGTVFRKALGYALLVGLCITCYVIVDKQTLSYLSPLGLIEISNFGVVVALTKISLQKGLVKREWQVNWRKVLIGAVCAPGSYLLFLFAMEIAPLAHISPIREIGTVFGTVLGILILKENQGVRRIVMSTVIAGGIISLGLWG
ncbi:EamA family transporter [Paenibacillus sp. MBLB4367]|uniref:EamA family transporter n=1 Tax=Paenibacillus sp. MBLB4367 TaxID=3384767 RepID=UPI003907FFD4